MFFKLENHIFVLLKNNMLPLIFARIFSTYLDGKKRGTI